MRTKASPGSEFAELSADAIMTWSTQIIMGLEQAHSQDLVHGNMSDTHILVDYKQGEVSCLLANFAIPSLRNASEDPLATTDAFFLSPSNVTRIREKQAL